MRNVTKMGLAAAALLAFGTGAARADLTIQNQTKKPVWYTIYEYAGGSQHWGCLMPQGVYRVPTGTWFKQGMIAYVRGELKNGNDCGGKTASDTGKGSPISIGSNTLKQYWDVAGRLTVK